MSLTANLRLSAVLLLFFALTLRLVSMIPPLEGPDERNHFGYITDMRQYGRLPNPVSYEDYLAFHESGQPPLYYVLAWGWSLLGPDYEWDGLVPLNIWVEQASAVPGDNRNQYLLGALHMPHNPEMQTAATWARYASLLLGMLAVAAAWRVSRLLLPPGWALFVVLIFAFNPVLMRGFAVAGNDSAALVLGALAVWGLLRMISAPLYRTPRTARRLLLVGLALALGALSKASLLVFAVAAVMLLAVRLYDDRRRLLWALALLLLPVLFLAAPWYGWNAIQHGDPFGTNPHLEMPWAFVPARPVWDALRAEFSILPSIWLDIGLPHQAIAPGLWARAVPLTAALLALVGGAMALWRVRHGSYEKRRALAVVALLLIVGGMGAAFVRWSLNFTAIGGRLLLPGYLALTLLVGLGLYALGIPRWLRNAFAALTVFIAFVSVALIVPRAFGVVTLPPERAPVLEGREELAFGEIEFLGYRIAPPVLTPDVRAIDVMLCWRSTHAEGLLEVPQSVVFAIINGDLSIGGRETYPGMGSYTLWQAGSAHCDRFAVPLIYRPRHGEVYNVMVGLYDPELSGLMPDNFSRGLFVGEIRVVDDS